MRLEAIKWTVSLALYASMIGLCLMWFERGGAAGLGLGALGFALGYFAPGQTSGGERVGNGYVASLVGLVLGFLGGAAFTFLLPHIEVIG